MVEKIIVNPESVRGWGNIVMEHTVEDYSLVGSSILVDSDTVMGVESTVYTIEAEDSTISVALVSSVASCSIGDSVVLSATVLDDEVPVEGGTVTFKLGSSTLGTDETDSDGVATYTYTTSDVGSLNFTALYESHNSNTVSVVVSHDYSIAFDSSSYSTSDGNVTAYVTLLDNSNPVSGASISLTGTGSTLSATTNSSGVATFNLTGISADCTITATYSNVSDTATITVASYIINDDASADNSSTLFGSSIALRNSGSNTTGWNSSGYYTVKTHSSGQRESFRVLAPLTGITTDMVIEWDGYSEQTSGTDGLVIYNSSTAWEKLSDNVDSSKQCWYGYNDGSFHETLDHMSQVTYQRWCHYKYTIIGKQFTVEVTYNGSTVWERTETLHFDRSSSTMYGFNSEWDANRTTRYKNIVAYKI